MENEPILLGPGEGRTYDLATMTAVFKADGPETQDSYSISEWTLEPGCVGVGAHAHESNDDTFYVVSGTVTFVLDGHDRPAGPGAFVRVPRRMHHDFRNDTDRPATFLNVYVPGGFEADMPSIVDWFAANPG